jgi:Mrp family chromosome partitioning ATPase
MPLRFVQERPDLDCVNVDSLRLRLERELAVPAVIALTSATAEDGKELIARGLAHSFASIGYATLLIDTAPAGRTIENPPQGVVLAGIGRLHVVPDVGSGTLAVLSLTDPTLHRATSFHAMKMAIGYLRGKFESVEILQGKFDYVVISTDTGTANAVATAILTTANAVLVTVARGRRKTAEDRELVTELERLGARFMGLVVVAPALVAAANPRRAAVSATPALGRAGPTKPSLIARVARGALRWLGGGRKEKKPPLELPATPESQTALISSP